MLTGRVAPYKRMRMPGDAAAQHDWSTQVDKESIDARADDALAADDFVADPARRPVSWRNRDRFAHHRGTDPPLYLSRRPHPRAAAGQRAGPARGRPGRARGDLGVERLSALRALLRGVRQRGDH